MFVSPETISLMAKLGVLGEDAVALIHAFEKDMVAQNAPRVGNAERQARHRAKKAAEKAGVTDNVTRNAPSNGEDNAERNADPLPSSFLPPTPPNQPTTHPRVDITTREKRATRRVPPLWDPSGEDLETGLSLGFASGEIERELAKFRDHTFGTARSDWSATFRNWLRTAAERKPRNDRPSPSTKFAARQENHARSFAGAEIAARARALQREGG